MALHILSKDLKWVLSRRFFQGIHFEKVEDYVCDLDGANELVVGDMAAQENILTAIEAVVTDKKTC